MQKVKKRPRGKHLMYDVIKIVILGVCSLGAITDGEFLQRRYWIIFKDKGVQEDTVYVSDRAVCNRIMLGLPTHQFTDIPVSASYIKELTTSGLHIRVSSRWLNAVSVLASEEEIQRVKQFPFVQSVIGQDLEPVYMDHERDILNLYAFEQINSDILAESGLTGHNVPVGVIDGGFAGARYNKHLNHLFKNHSILATKKFVNLTSERFFEDPRDSHGELVLQMLGGEKMGPKQVNGLAHDAKFYLAFTDERYNEYAMEEDYWIAALEWLDSLGVRLVNSSVGYSYGFDNPEENHQVKEVNGKTTMITRAAQIACKDKGMIIVAAAGNDGRDEHWRVVAVPADAKNVITVGGVDENSRKVSHSSIGPEDINYIKPDIACFTSRGTSFSAPVITGAIACLLQAYPELTNKEIRRLLHESSHLYPYGNNYVGYGIPDISKVLDELDTIANPASVAENKVKVKTDSIVFTFKRPEPSGQTIDSLDTAMDQPVNQAEGQAGLRNLADSLQVFAQIGKEHIEENAGEYLLIYHKNKKWRVLREEWVSLDTLKTFVLHKKQADNTTVYFSSSYLLEIDWK